MQIVLHVIKQMGKAGAYVKIVAASMIYHGFISGFITALL
jgi:hypothetical protein